MSATNHTTRYAISDVAKMLKLSKRSVQRLAAKHDVPKDLEGYIFTDETVRQMRHKPGATSRSNDGEVIEDLAVGLHRAKNGNLVQVFTEDQYKKFEEALIHRKHLLKEIERLEQWRQDFFDYTNQRNTIEAKEKGLIQDIENEIQDIPSEDADIQSNLNTKRLEILNKKSNSTQEFAAWMESLKD
jgi:hypothetical protein